MAEVESQSTIDSAWRYAIGNIRRGFGREGICAGESLAMHSWLTWW
jgi:outer membrane protein OmpA-like peptidoglycan-associated protein